MAISLELTVGLLLINVLFSAASSETTTSIPTTTADNTTTTSSDTTTAAADVDKTSTTPTPTTNVQSTPTQDLKAEVTYLKASFKVNSSCGQDMDGNLTEGIKKLFKDSQFDYKNVTFDSTNDSEGTCRVNITLMFGPGLTRTDIIDKFTNLTLDGGFDIREMTTATQVPGVKLGIKFEPNESECMQKCCKGAGGPITVRKFCEPVSKCSNYKGLEKTVSDCMSVCTCSGMTIKISVTLLLLGAITNWLLN